MLILAAELHGFLVVHHNDLIPQECHTLDSLRSFFTRHVFPLVSDWLNNFSLIFKQELRSPLSVEKKAYSTITKEDLVNITRLITKSASVNPNIVYRKICANFGRFNCVQPFSIETFASLWWLKVKTALHDSMLRCIEEDIYTRMANRPSSGLFNFTENDISSNLQDLLLKGIKFAPSPPLQPIQRLSSQFSSEIISQALWYRRKIERNLGKIPKSSPHSMLRYLINNSTTPHKMFYETIYKKYIECSKSLSLSTSIAVPPSLPDFSPPPDCCWNIADKHFGILLLPTVFILQQEEKMLKNLGGTKLDISTSLVIENVFSKINSLKSSLSSDASTFLAKFKLPPESECYVPFLKLQGKVNKLSSQDISGKDFSSLKFRPIIDSSKFPTQPLSSALRQLLVDLNSAVISKFPCLRIIPRSGWEFANTLHSLNSFPDTGLSVMFVCNLSDSYTNYKLDDLLKSVNTLTSALGDEFPEWKKELILTLSNFILCNSYVQAANNCWKCGTSLPMGSACSGDSLDTICLAGELSYLSTNLNTNNNETSTSSLFYRRFRDDIFSISCSSSIKHILNTLQIFCSVFHQRIPLQFKFSILLGCFLDCVLLKNITNNSYSTLPRLNLSAPISIPHQSSSSPLKYVYNSVFTNLLRVRRICNEDSIFLVYIEVIKDELRQSGYHENTISSIFQRCLTSITNNFSSTSYHRIMEKEVKIYPPAVNFIPCNIHNMVKECVHLSLLACGKNNIVSNPAVKSPHNLKDMLFTRKKHLKAIHKADK